MTYNIDRLTIATLNAGKMREIGDLLAGAQIEILSLADLDDIAEVDETGQSFAANAALKAAGYARITSTFTLADDSGLVIDALDGRPGVLSARYGGDIPFNQKMDLILAEMLGIPQTFRTARFVCAMAIAEPRGAIIHISEGICEGSIAEKVGGDGGFGYDPIFVPVGFDSTFAQLSSADKHSISHRGRALGQIIPFLRDNTAI